MEEKSNKNRVKTEYQITSQKKHIENLEIQLKEIRAAKTFKVWQAFTKFKKNPKLIFKFIKIFVKEGNQGIKRKLQTVDTNILNINYNYNIWYQNNYPNLTELKKQKNTKFKHNPLISIIIPVYNPEKKFLEECLDSVINQSYSNWELCLADDCSTKTYVRSVLEQYSKKDKRIKIYFRKENGHICNSSNSALTLATGEYVALLDDDDIIWPNALFENVKYINKYPKAELLYSDEDKLEEDGVTHTDPFFKPNWSPDYLRQINYITHFAVIKNSLVKKVNGFKPGNEGAQDWDLFLRTSVEIEKSKNERNKIIHIPTVLYSWRKSPTSTASEKYIGKVKSYAYENQKKVLLQDLKNRGLEGEIIETGELGLNYIKYNIFKNPLVSIIIPTKDKYDLIKNCVNSILSKSTYSNYELIIVDTGSVNEDTLSFYKTLKKYKQIKIIDWNEKFNFSSVCNYGAKQANGQHLIFLNNDTKIITPEWIENMLQHSQRNNIGVVGAKLLFENYSVQHAGIIVGLTGFAGHIYQKEDFYNNSHFPFGKTQWNRNFLAVTGACFMIKSDLYKKLNGMKEDLSICGNDVDLCIRAYNLGYYNIYSANTELFHFESKTRNVNDIPKLDFINSFESYKYYLKNGDPFFNPNLSYWSTTPTVKTKEEENPYDFANNFLKQNNKINISYNKNDNIQITPIQQEALYTTQWYDFSKKDFENNLNNIKNNNKPIDIRTANWFIPEFNAIYAGINNILMFSNFLQEKGIKNNFIVDTDKDLSSVKNLISENFENLKNCQLYNINYKNKIPTADISIATLWTTAYHLLKFNKTKRKLYFIQDYETLFYPSGSESALVENTYNFGFTGISNIEILHNLYQNKYHNKSILLKSHIDFKKFLNQKKCESKPPYKVFFYGRPNHPRNGFELGIEALKKLKQIMKDKVQIFSAGASWNPSQFNLDGIVENLGLLPLNELPKFYESMDAGLFLMFSGHPGVIPFELMASKCPVVINKNNIEGWEEIYKDKQNCLTSNNSASQIAENLKLILTNQELRKKIINNGLIFIDSFYPDYEKEATKVLNFIENII